LSTKREHKVLNYQTVTPATVLQVLFLVASECFNYAEYSEGFSLSNIGTGLASFAKGVFCGFVIIFTGVFALLEYLICFLEFMLVSSVGVILFPMSIWEGSKFMTESFIKAILGFFLKLLFCNLAIFLLIYGFVSLLKIISQTGFIGTVDQLVFIVFICALFFYICKSAPGIAQSLLSGSPSLSASGAISAATGAVAAAGSVMGLAGKVGGKVAGAATGGLIGGIGSLKEANAARHSSMDAVKEAGGSEKQQKAAGRKAFGDSLKSDVGDAAKSAGLGLTRSLLGGVQKGSGGSAGGINPHSWLQDFKNTPGKEGHQTVGEHMDKRRDEGRTRGQASADKFISKDKQLSANREINTMHAQREKEKTSP
jgi:type IV secretory pathway TrbL component